MTWGVPHDWSIDLGIYRLCSRCCKPDLVATRRMPCRPLSPGAAEAAIRRKVDMARRFRGSPSVATRPFFGKPHRRKQGAS